MQSRRSPSRPNDSAATAVRRLESYAAARCCSATSSLPGTICEAALPLHLI